MFRIEWSVFQARRERFPIRRAESWTSRSMFSIQSPVSSARLGGVVDAPLDVPDTVVRVPTPVRAVPDRVGRVLARQGQHDRYIALFGDMP